MNNHRNRGQQAGQAPPVRPGPDICDALAGPFADWALLDLGDGPTWRAVAARR